jgi:hypothetical protein
MVPSVLVGCACIAGECIYMRSPPVGRIPVYCGYIFQLPRIKLLERRVGFTRDLMKL